MPIKEIEFEEINEKWSYYTLDDGTIIKVKIVLIKVIDEGNGSPENPTYGLQTAPILGTKVTREFKNEPLEDIPFTPKSEVWNEYKLKSGFTLMLKPILAQVNRTGTFDQKGVPVYTMQVQPLVKIKK